MLLRWKMKISKLQWKAYLEVQSSAVTNMFDIKIVSNISGLDKEHILYIMKNYSELKEEYGDDID